jgi:hypothetical protein
VWGIWFWTEESVLSVWTAWSRDWKSERKTRSAFKTSK